MKLTTTIDDFSVYTNNSLEASNYLNKAGFKYIDYSFCSDFKNNIGFFSNDYDGWLKKLKENAEEKGLKYVQAHAPMGKPISQNEHQRPFIGGTKKCIRACHDLGIENLVVHSGWERGLSREETFERNRDFYNELLQYSENYGVNVLTENFDKMYIDGIYWIDNPCDLKTLIDYVNHPLFHACFDVGHANLQDMPQHEQLAMLGEHVKAIHIQDNCGDEDYHLAPLLGTVNLDSVMAGLKSIDYTGYFTLEAINFPMPPHNRKPFDGEDIVGKLPLEIKHKTESLLYEIGKYILTSYNCFEE